MFYNFLFSFYIVFYYFSKFNTPIAAVDFKCQNTEIYACIETIITIVDLVPILVEFIFGEQRIVCLDTADFINNITNSEEKSPTTANF